MMSWIGRFFSRRPFGRRDTAPSTAAKPTADPVARPIALHLGLDFGTRFTKACVRNVGAERSSVVLFDQPRTTRGLSIEHALLVSAVLVRDERVLAGLTPAEWAAIGPGTSRRDQVVEYLKMRVAALDESRLGAVAWQPPPLARLASTDLEALTVFYLARAITRCRARVEELQRDWLTGRIPRWSISLGVPAEHADSTVRKRFERLLRLAETWTREVVPAEIRLDDLRGVMMRLARQDTASPTDVWPEVAAAVEAFVRTPQVQDGVYLYFDVGAGTFDGNSFRLYRPAGGLRQVNVYSARVVPLGVAALAERLAGRVGVGVDEARRSLDATDGLPDHMKTALDESLCAGRSAVAYVVMAGKGKEPVAWREGLQAPARESAKLIPAFVSGGGHRSYFYCREVIERTYEAHGFHSVGVRPWRVANLPVPGDLDLLGLPKECFQRLAVAYGLSIPPGERSEPGSPGDIDALPSPAPHGPGPKQKGPGVPYHDSKEVLE